MIVSSSAPKKRVEQNKYSFVKNIKLYGKDNDYPQKISDIVDSSGTGTQCFRIYTKFIKGGGFADPVLNKFVLNSNNERAYNLLKKCADDIRKFDGFAILVKYNLFYQPIEFFHVPFEHCRLEINKDKDYTGKIAYHPDWNNDLGKGFDVKDIKFIHKFNPQTVKEEIEEAGGAQDYLGQIYYYTASGDFDYPICPFDAVVTDMLTEDSISTIKHRNARYGFLPSGVLVRRGKKPKTIEGQIDETDPYYQQQITSANEIKALQGDTNAAKIWVVDIFEGEDKPEFIDFTPRNYDKEYSYTEETIQQNIARMSYVPPILRGIDVGAGFASELMQQAYNFMNSITEDERDSISNVFSEVLNGFPFAQFTNFDIAEKTYLIKESNGSISD